MKLIGVGGLPRSGKDTLAEFLIQKGYFGFSFGDFTRQHSRLRHQDKADPISVENMTETSNWLRDTKGPDVILKAALEEFESKQSAGGKHKGLVLFSVRAPVEADWILARGGELVWVDASDQVRYNRAMQNLRPGEPRLSMAEFKRQEDLQWQPQPGIPVDAQMNISYVKSKATIIINNDGNDIEEFKKDAQEKLRL